MRHALIVFGAALIALLLTASCTSNTGRVLLVNKSSEAISRATLVFSWGERIDVNDLAPIAYGDADLSCPRGRFLRRSRPSLRQAPDHARRRVRHRWLRLS